MGGSPQDSSGKRTTAGVAVLPSSEHAVPAQAATGSRSIPVTVSRLYASGSRVAALLLGSDRGLGRGSARRARSTAARNITGQATTFHNAGSCGCNRRGRARIIRTNTCRRASSTAAAEGAPGRDCARTHPRGRARVGGGAGSPRIPQLDFHVGASPRTAAARTEPLLVETVGPRPSASWDRWTAAAVLGGGGGGCGPSATGWCGTSADRGEIQSHALGRGTSPERPAAAVCM